LNSRQANVARSPGILSNRVLQTIMLSHVMLQIGIWVRNFAILLYVSEVTKRDPYAIALISVVEFAPIFVFSFIGGTFADRWRPKRTMIWCDLLSAVSVFAVLLAILFGSWYSVYFVTFISAILSQFSQPSGMRLFKRHLPAEQLQQGMALFQTMMAVFMVLGPMLGTFVYTKFGLEISIAVMGVMFLMSALVLLRLPEDDSVREIKSEKGQFLGELYEGFSYVWKSRMLRTLGVNFMLAGLGVGTAQALNLFVVAERLRQPDEFLQYLLMVNGAAMLIGGGLVAGIARRVAPQALLAFGMFGGAVCTVIVGYSTSIPLTLAAQFVSGLTFPCIHIGISTLILQWSHESIVGRVNGVLSPMFVGMMVVAMSVAGVLKDNFELTAIFTGVGLLFLIGMAVLVPVMRLKPPAEAVKGS